MTLVYGIPVNEARLGLKILPEIVNVEGQGRCIRVHSVESIDSFFLYIATIGPMPLVVMGASKEMTAFFTFLTPRSSGHAHIIPWVVTLGFVSTTTSTTSTTSTPAAGSPGDRIAFIKIRCFYVPGPRTAVAAVATVAVAAVATVAVATVAAAATATAAIVVAVALATASTAAALTITAMTALATTTAIIAASPRVTEAFMGARRWGVGTP